MRFARNEWGVVLVDFRIDVKGFWTAGEVSELAEQLLGVAIECSTEDGVVVVHPRPRALTTVERAQLAEELTKEERPSAAERQVAIEAEARAMYEREKAREAKLAAFRTKAKTGRVTVNDLTEAVLALIGE